MKKHMYTIDHILHWARWLLGIFLGIICLMTIYLQTHAEDLLEQAFSQAKTHETVINLGNTPNAVGNEFLRESVGIQDKFGVGCLLDGNMLSKKTLEEQKESVGSQLENPAFCQQVLGGDRNVPVLTKQAPLIVQITKWLLRLTIVLSITMVIYNGVMYIVESAKGAEVKDAKKNLMLVVGGILVALLSLGVITLISSITISTLGGNNASSKQNFTDKGCIVGTKAYAKGDPLKQLVCEESFGGTWDPNRIGNRCNINGKRKAITNEEEESKCSSDLGGVYKGEVGVACKIKNGEIKFGDALGGYVCLRAWFGHTAEVIGSDGIIIGREWKPKDCKINGDRKKITNDEKQDKCGELGGYIVQTN